MVDPILFCIHRSTWLASQTSYLQPSAGSNNNNYNYNQSHQHHGMADFCTVNYYYITIQQ